MLKWVTCTGGVIVFNLFFRSFNIFSERIINHYLNIIMNVYIYHIREYLIIIRKSFFFCYNKILSLSINCFCLWVFVF